ncbi:acyl-CoA dehydrogenase family protein [Polaromonas sp. JS666]|uniref:acyl-CoA dehydrogenase family protein n=1 Tax=Polaromonas sp. (strain JS666 / ATCC BAA-500) TaxID=296591 RepID=UPI00004647B1|nr:acyl-CoA dehydrogenase family protein [Polaromonas sp. JS666]ABE44480.1 acyl-CoA dehydrogenase-like protein [Polaromonas sp. JS666]
MDITHEVFNQPEPLADYNLFDTNRPLRDALKFNAPALDTTELAALGAMLGSTGMQTHARLANIHAPELHSHDRFGRRLDQVEFHPSYHELMKLAIGAGLHGTPWASPHPGPLPEGEGTGHPAPKGKRVRHPLPLGEGRGEGLSPHVLRAAGFMLFTELEPSVLCPISMTYAVTPALRSNAAIYADWAPGLTGRAYDSELKPWQGKAGLTMGMGMTEKQGGSDVRANTTRAEPAGSDGWGARYTLTGHKWFFSAPMCDAFLVLAQTTSGLSCFFLPRILPDGSLNAIRIQRLKDKLGNKANASSEVEFEGAQAWLVGEEGRGIPQILEMGTMTRLDCALGTSGLMRQALSLALNHTSQRKAFGKLLIDQPLMRNVLADLALESEAATALALRLARAFDRAADAHEAVMARLLTPIAKFWICKRGSHFAQEAMECLGGNGYVEEGGVGVMARIYREMPLNSIWEGAGNIMALDLLRALRKADAVAALEHELSAARGAHPALDRLAAALPTRVEQMATELEARRLAQDVALAVQAALLLQTAPAPVFSAFCDSRISGNWGQTFGTLAAGTDFDTIIARAMPR